jgi:hypothetical protein
VAQRDLCALCLVSKHFHALALAQLYRKLAIMFPFEEGPFCQAHEAAVQLDAIVTSTHEPARFLKEVVVDAHKTGPPSVDRTYIDSPCALSCGKYLSTLLLLTLRRAKALESFWLVPSFYILPSTPYISLPFLKMATDCKDDGSWNVRMVLGRNVLEQLHGMSSLRKLHLRLQTRQPSRSAGNVVVVADAGNGLNNFHSPLQGAGAGAVSGSLDKTSDAGGAKSSLAKPFLSFSGFKHLTSLAVLDIDTLDYIPDIALCIRQCSSTLEHFHISLSESMAKRAASPPPDQSVASETDEDDFGVPLAPLPPPPPPPGLDSSGLPAQSNELSAGAEFKAQEQIMDKLFGVGLAESAALTAAGGQGQKGAGDKAAPGAGAPGKISMPELAVFKTCVEKFLSIFKKFLDASEKGNWSEFQAEKPLWDLIQKVAQTTDGASGTATIGALANGGLLSAGDGGSGSSASTAAGAGGQAGAVSTLASMLALGGASAADKSEGGGGGGSGGSGDGVAESASVQESQAVQKTNAAAEAPQPMQIEPPSRTKTKVMASKGGDLLPEDINIDYPDADESAVDDPEPMEGVVNGDAASQSEGQPQASSSGDALNGAVDHNADAAVTGDDEASEKRAGGPAGDTIDAAEGSASSHKAAAATTSAHGKAQVDKQPMSDKTATAAPHQQPQQQWSGADAVKEYVRATRKLSLRTLRVYLVPLRATALHRGVETAHLQRIALLNVGPQGAFWRQLLAAGRTAPLQLRSVHTDDVTAAFVALAASLPALAELYLLKRSRRFRAMLPLGEPSAVGMRDIRRRILQRHVGTLQRLKIQNNNDRAWDADEKTVVLLADKGRRLSELCISLALSDFVSFFFPPSFFPHHASISAAASAAAFLGDFSNELSRYSIAVSNITYCLTNTWGKCFLFFIFLCSTFSCNCCRASRACARCTSSSAARTAAASSGPSRRSWASSWTASPTTRT